MTSHCHNIKGKGFLWSSKMCIDLSTYIEIKMSYLFKYDRNKRSENKMTCNCCVHIKAISQAISQAKFNDFLVVKTTRFTWFYFGVFFSC